MVFRIAKRSRRCRFAASLATVLAAASPAVADSGPPAAVAAVRARLAQWTEDFNARQADKVCDLFSRDAVSQFRGQPERGYDEICALLKRSVNDKSKTYSYALDLKEVIAEGDIAVARLVWTLTVAPMNATSAEPGMDVFRREADGKWRIIRYVAYTEPDKPE